MVQKYNNCCTTVDSPDQSYKQQFRFNTYVLFIQGPMRRAGIDGAPFRLSYNHVVGSCAGEVPPGRGAQQRKHRALGRHEGGESMRAHM